MTIRSNADGAVSDAATAPANQDTDTLAPDSAVQTTGPERVSALDGPPRRLASASRRGADAVRRLRAGKATGVLAGLIIVSVFLAIQQPVFFTWSNWENIIRTQSTIFSLSIGMTFVTLTAGIDLSVASIAAASGMAVGLLMEHGASAEVGIAGGLAMGVVMGFINGLLIGAMRVPFFVVTLGTLSIFQSVALLVTQGNTISLFGTHNFSPIASLANGSIGPIPTVAVILLALFAVSGFVLHFTPFGRSVYAVGSNPEAARLTGISGRRVLIAVYTLSGLFAGFGAVIATGRLTGAGPQVDPNLLLTVIAAVLIGGTAFTGGEGGLLGTIIGVFFLGVIQNGLSLSNISTFWQGTVSGTILILAVGIGVLRDRDWALPRWLVKHKEKE